ncbi:MerR family transcriptional regulator [Knoellia subterranea KCTC 19937]|uniref:MerR family transcriptional regulator n=1 Tax=Knoellia subterranea KCTC 19937 TaxID=1385521 RepID=A0A0A0JL64_9MICO|nr:MerR family transcriptional regulator [Knoellia subterranea KCTC 19937]
MRLAELSASTGVSVATLKYYLREGLLQPGAVVSKTQADYDESHVERVRLVRALSEVGGLPLATIGQVLEIITAPGHDWIDVLRAAQRSLVKPLGDNGFGATDGRGRARAWVDKRGWLIEPDDPFLDELDRAWAASDAGGIGFDEDRLDRYADHVEGIARVDVSTVPEEQEAAIRQVIIGTILVDPVLAALRRLAQQHVSRSQADQA